MARFGGLGGIGSDVGLGRYGTDRFKNLRLSDTGGGPYYQFLFSEYDAEYAALIGGVPPFGELLLLFV